MQRCDELKMSASGRSPRCSVDRSLVFTVATCRRRDVDRPLTFTLPLLSRRRSVDRSLVFTLLSVFAFVMTSS